MHVTTRTIITAFSLFVSAPVAAVGFSEVAVTAGVSTTHGLQFGPYGEPDMMSGGIGAGDVNADGRPDIVVLRGDLGAAKLYINQGDGTFVDEAAARTFNLSNNLANGVLIADVEGDGDLDIVVGGQYIADAGYESPPRMWRNDGTGNFAEDRSTFGDWDGYDTWSAALGDSDGDGDLDLVFGRWTRTSGNRVHLLRNDGTAHFSPADAAAGLGGQFSQPNDHSFTPNFADINDDGRADLLVTGDFGSSRVFLQQPGGVFTNVTTSVISDENGMGAAVADFDNDGDLDWFVSSIYDPGTPAGNWGTTGNRLYRNDGNGQFTDVTTQAGVRDGAWGWGSCFADFDADGWLDLYMVNGMLGPVASIFNADRARLFMSNGDGTFTESAAAMGVDDDGQGRGIVCLDYDSDGAIDIMVQNGYGATKLYHNDIVDAGNTVAVHLHGASPNQFGIGARIWLTSAGVEQMREMSAGNNFLSNNPPIAYFGLGTANRYERIRVRWPDGTESVVGHAAGLSRTIDADVLFVDGLE